MDRIRVLIVEDDLNWLSIFYHLVGNATKELFEYTHVNSIKDALSAVINNSFELILLDLMLPDSEAVSTIQTMTTQINFIPIVITTTLDDESLMLNAFRHGVDNYLVKDQYEVKTFIHVCRQAIRRFSARMMDRLDENTKKILLTLQSIDNNLENWEQKTKLNH